MIQRCFCLALLLLAAGCSYMTDPYSRPYTWVPLGVNDANLRVMVADPADLIRGRGEDAALGAESAPPVERLLTGKRYPIPVTSASGIELLGEQGGGAPQGGGNAGQ